MEMPDEGKTWTWILLELTAGLFLISRNYVIRADTNVSESERVSESESLFSFMETYNAKPWKQNMCYTDINNISVLAPRGAHYIQFCMEWRRQPGVVLERSFCTKQLHAYLKQERKLLFLKGWLGATLLFLRLGLLTQSLKSTIVATIWNERNWTGSVWTFPQINPISYQYCFQGSCAQMYSYCHQKLNNPLVICYILVLLPGKSHGQRSLVGCSPWGREESDRTEWLPFHFSLSCIGEGNGNPLQCSCLENPRDREAWWAAISGVTQSRTWLKWIGSSSISNHIGLPLWLTGKESACNAGATGDVGLIPGLGRSPGGGHGNMLQYSCLENPMDRGAWWLPSTGPQSWTQLKWLSTHAQWPYYHVWCL